jgi:hypothetical protein
MATLDLVPRDRPSPTTCERWWCSLTATTSVATIRCVSRSADCREQAWCVQARSALD